MPQRDAIETSFRTKPSSSHQAGSNDGGGKPSNTAAQQKKRVRLRPSFSWRLASSYSYVSNFVKFLSTAESKSSMGCTSTRKWDVSLRFILTANAHETGWKSHVTGLARPWAKPPSSPWPSISAALKQTAATQIAPTRCPRGVLW